jgi:hypothetical protein
VCAVSLVVTGSKGVTSCNLERGARVATGNNKKVRCLPPLAAVRVRAAAGLVNDSDASGARVSLSGEIEREAEREELPGINGSTPASLLSRGRDLAAEALVG